MTQSGRPVAAGCGEGGDATAMYALGSSRGESARLQRQADELAPDSAALLDRVGLGPGQSAVDLGCGPRGLGPQLSQCLPKPNTACSATGPSYLRPRATPRHPGPAQAVAPGLLPFTA